MAQIALHGEEPALNLRVGRVARHVLDGHILRVVVCGAEEGANKSGRESALRI